MLSTSNSIFNLFLSALSVIIIYHYLNKFSKDNEQMMMEFFDSSLNIGFDFYNHSYFLLDIDAS